jgi:hypothetical protein
MASPPQSKRGKPLQKFDLELVEKLTARGLSYKQLAMNIKTVKKHRILNPALQEAISRGRVKGLTEITDIPKTLQPRGGHRPNCPILFSDDLPGSQMYF